jgi:hypothetical protein
MGCALRKQKDGSIGFMCGRLVRNHPCATCGCDSDFLCDYPVGKAKTCDALLCWEHAHEVAPGVHYCNGHFQEWEEFRLSGGVKNILENVTPFGSSNKG